MDDMRDQLNGYGFRLNELERSLARCQGHMVGRADAAVSDIKEAKQSISDLYNKCDDATRERNKMRIEAEKMAGKIVKDVSVVVGLVILVITTISMFLQPIISNLVK